MRVVRPLAPAPDAAGAAPSLERWTRRRLGDESETSLDRVWLGRGKGSADRCASARPALHRVWLACTARSCRQTGGVRESPGPILDSASPSGLACAIACGENRRDAPERLTERFPAGPLKLPHGAFRHTLPLTLDVTRALLRFAEDLPGGRPSLPKSLSHVSISDFAEFGRLQVAPGPRGGSNSGVITLTDRTVPYNLKRS